ncbi:MAG TPA: hypothetical protein VNK52_03975 [Hyphomicrobiaceae bacterium]|nr:hypothetical protein [Hyphomicrobiaceae bacterium]
MIAHVAEAGEARGRVVLQLATGRPSAIAIDAAIRLAQAFQSEIESLFVEDEQLIELSGFPFAREISFSGRSMRTLSTSDIERDMRFVFSEVRRRIEARARQAEVPLRQTVVRGEPIKALAAACAECGPWNVVALAEPFTSPACPPLRQLFEAVSGTTGLILVGPAARRTDGPIVVAVEDTDRLSGMLRAAERLARVDEAEIIVWLVADDNSALATMEGQTRLLLAGRNDVRLELTDIGHLTPAAISELLRRLRAGFIVAQFSGVVVPGEGDLRPLSAGLECPLLLVR